jgi:hypothetical protein
MDQTRSSKCNQWSPSVGMFLDSGMIDMEQRKFVAITNKDLREDRALLQAKTRKKKLDR